MARFDQEHEVELGLAIGDLSCLAFGTSLFEEIGKFNGGEEADFAAPMFDGPIAVTCGDGSTDAAALHPALFGSAEGARKAFDRAGFGGQNPIGISYGEMSLKSARYRRGRRGSFWQMFCWVDGDTAGVRLRLERVLRELDGWLPG